MKFDTSHGSALKLDPKHIDHYVKVINETCFKYVDNVSCFIVMEEENKLKAGINISGANVSADIKGSFPNIYVEYNGRMLGEIGSFDNIEYIPVVESIIEENNEVIIDEPVIEEKEVIIDEPVIKEKEEIIIDEPNVENLEVIDDPEVEPSIVIEDKIEINDEVEHKTRKKKKKDN